MMGMIATFCQFHQIITTRISLSVSINSTESDKRRDLFEAIEYPSKTMFEEVQFPPVTAVRAE